MEIFLLYLWTRLDIVIAISSGIAVVAIIGFIGCIIFLSEPIYSWENREDAQQKRATIKKWQRHAVIAGVISGFIVVVTPSQKDAAIIVAGSGVIQAARSETAQRLASKSVQIIEGALDKYLSSQTAK